MAMKIVTQEEVKELEAQIEKAEGELADKNERMEEIYSDFEKGMTLIGASGVEDKLQTGVPETISDLRSSKIRVWMLTGDKLETAESIGFSCKLLD